TSSSGTRRAARRASPGASDPTHDRIERDGVMAERIVLLPGDGIGPEVTEQARRVLVAAGKRFGIEFEFVTELIGGCSIDAHGAPLRDEVIALCKQSRAVLLGAVGG